MFRSYQGESSSWVKKALSPTSLKLNRPNSVIPERMDLSLLVFNFLRNKNFKSK